MTPLDEAKPGCRVAAVENSPGTATEATIDALHGILVECKGERRFVRLGEAGEFMAVMEAEGYNVMRTTGSFAGRGAPWAGPCRSG